MPKTQMSRFHIHDELTAPEGSVPVLKGALATGGQLPNFLGVLAGSPAALRGYARFRSELRHGELDARHARAHRARGRRALRLAARDRLHSRMARTAGLGIDEVALAREFDSQRRARGRAAALPQGRSSTPARARRCTSTRRRARPAGATSSSSRRSPTCAGELHRADQRRRRGPGRRLGRGGARRGAASRVGRWSDVAMGGCCPYYHEAIELIGKRWTGAIVVVLLDDGPLRFSRDRRGRARALRPPALRADEGARGPRPRRAPRARGPAGRVEYAPDRDGPGAGAGAQPAQGVGAALAARGRRGRGQP